MNIQTNKIKTIGKTIWGVYVHKIVWIGRRLWKENKTRRRFERNRKIWLRMGSRVVCCDPQLTPPCSGLFQKDLYRGRWSLTDLFNHNHSLRSRRLEVMGAKQERSPRVSLSRVPFSSFLRPSLPRTCYVFFLTIIISTLVTYYKVCRLLFSSLRLRTYTISLLC